MRIVHSILLIIIILVLVMLHSDIAMNSRKLEGMLDIRMFSSFLEQRIEILEERPRNCVTFGK